MVFKECIGSWVEIKTSMPLSSHSWFFTNIIVQGQITLLTMTLIPYLLCALHIFTLLNAHPFTQSQPHGKLSSQVHKQQVLGLDHGSNAKHPQPFYAIAHRVLSSAGVRAALSHGANALEIDMTAHVNKPLTPGYGWWAQHDAIPSGAGDTAEKIFETIAEERRQGNNVIFVWLDIKNPDECDPAIPKQHPCSIEYLRDLARTILEPEGIRLLYGFGLKGVTKRAFGVIREGLNSNEKIDIDGRPHDVMASFSSQKLGRVQSVMSRGLFDMRLWFGDCNKDRLLGNLCYDLRIASENLASHDHWCSHVFGWTILKNQKDLVDSLLDKTNIDGLIYGRPANEYVDSEGVRNALGAITDWIERHPGDRFLADNSTAW